MLPFHGLQLLVLVSSLLPISIQGQSSPNPCNSEDFSFMRMNTGRNITSCKKLGALGAELGWNYQDNTSIVEIVFSARPPTKQHGWIAWGVNPGPRPQMVGTRALIAFRKPNGSMEVTTYNITIDTKHGCKLEHSQIEFNAWNFTSSYSRDTNFMTFWATLNLSSYNISSLNHVWQVGPGVVGEIPQVHEKSLQNLISLETIDLKSGQGTGKRSARLRVAHGVLSVIGWGILLPAGVISSRYFRGSPVNYKRWFFVHVTFQILAFLLGTTGWAIGLSLMNESKRYSSFMGHKVIGILIFCLATLQMMALWLKPKKMDKYRKYWTIYHHFVGYSLIVLVIVNIFKGFAILKPPSSWKWAYIGILIALSCVAFLLEIGIWVVFFYYRFKNWIPTATTPSQKAT